MNMKKVVAVTLILSSMTAVSASAAEFNDIKGHWAEDVINELADTAVIDDNINVAATTFFIFIPISPILNYSLQPPPVHASNSLSVQSDRPPYRLYSSDYKLLLHHLYIFRQFHHCP